MESTDKPVFKHKPKNGTIETARRVYTEVPVGLEKIYQLRAADYGKGFRQATFGESLDLVHASYLNQGNVGADDVVGAIMDYFLSGNTSILYTPELVIVQDMPEVRDGRIVMSEKDLTSKLSRNAMKGVRFSDDGTIRSLPYGFETGLHNQDKMRNNPFPIALTGDLEAGQKLAQIQQKIGDMQENYDSTNSENAVVSSLGRGTNNVIRVPGLWANEIGLLIGGNWGDLSERISFGVRQ
ncbi:MAG: hypothetical protein FJZ43_04515 [Candidatus Staskawiczbacteria bacterium]|nr:hypothetical protein [Candidatus Staskawiczbacteria bacterium]